MLKFACLPKASISHCKDDTRPYNNFANYKISFRVAIMAFSQSLTVIVRDMQVLVRSKSILNL